MLEGLLGLFKDLGVAHVEHVKDTVCIHSYRVVGVIPIRYLGRFLFYVYRKYCFLLDRAQQ